MLSLIDFKAPLFKLEKLNLPSSPTQAHILSGPIAPIAFIISAPFPKNDPNAPSSMLGILFGFTGSAQKLIMLPIAATSLITPLRFLSTLSMPVWSLNESIESRNDSKTSFNSPCNGFFNSSSNATVRQIWRLGKSKPCPASKAHIISFKL